MIPTDSPFRMRSIIRLLHSETSKPRRFDKRSGPELWDQAFRTLDCLFPALDSDLCASVLRCCGNAKALSDGKEVHHHIVRNVVEPTTYLGNLLVQMYGNCGALEDAHACFTRMCKRDQFSWMFLITANARNGHGQNALLLFDQMQSEDVVPDKFILASILSVCASQAALAQGRQLHAHVMKSGLELDMVLGSALVHMYAKCANLEDAERAFHNMPQRNSLSWTAMIAAHAQHGQCEDALKLFDQMQQDGLIPDEITFTSLFPAFATKAALVQGKQMHSRIAGSELEGDLIVENALINMYGRCGSQKDARQMFDKMTKRDTVTWTAMIGIYAQHAHNIDAFPLFDQMQLEGITANKVTFVNILSACDTPDAQRRGKLLHACITGTVFEADVVVGNALVNMYGKCGRLHDAQRMFEKMPERDTVSWTALIAAHVQFGLGKDALELFERMLQCGTTPNKVTFITILSACASQLALVEGRQMHTYVADSGLELDVVVGTALINMYGKCGSLEEAFKVFDKMTERNNHAWAAVIAAHAQTGNGEQALRLFRNMQQEGLTPDEATFVSILSACSHAGLADEGNYFFKSMHQDYGIKPVLDHYHCMIDLLGRVGRLEEAESMINEMPYRPTVVTWMTFLSACRKQVDVERAKYAADCAFKLDPENVKPYVILSNIYAAVGRGDAAADVMNRIKASKLQILVLPKS